MDRLCNCNDQKSGLLFQLTPVAYTRPQHKMHNPVVRKPHVSAELQCARSGSLTLSSPDVIAHFELTCQNDHLKKLNDSARSEF